MSLNLLLRYLGVGVIVALHWLCFYGSVKLANASVAATTMALASVFIAFIEPWIMRRHFNPAEFVLGIAIIPGVLWWAARRTHVRGLAIGCVVRRIRGHLRCA